MPSKQSDKLKKLLGMKEKRVPDMVRHREMNDVRNYNRNQQARVFENEKRQVARYADTNAPEKAKDIGATFKLQVYTLKLQSLLQAKQDAISQIKLVIGTANKINQQTGQVEITLGASQLRDARLAPYVNTAFGKAEILTTFNEMMAYIDAYMKDIFTDDRLRDTVYTAYFTPLEQALTACADQYPPFFALLQVRNVGGQQGRDNDQRAKDIFKAQTVQVFSLLMACAENIHIQALRPVSARDVSDYAENNDVDDLVEAGQEGSAVVPPQQPLPPGPSILPDRPDEPPPPQVDPQNPQFNDPNVPPAPQQPQPAPQQGQPVQRADLNSTIQALLAFEQANPAGLQYPLRRTAYRADPNVNDNGKGFRQAFRAWNDLGVGQGFQYPPPTAQLIADALRAIGNQRDAQGQAQQQQQQQQGQQSPPRARSPSPQGQQGGPARNTGADLRQYAQLNTGMFGISTNQSVCPILRAPFNNIDPNSDMGQVVDSIVSRIKAEEEQQGRVFNAKNPQDVDFVMGQLSPTRQQMWETEMPNEATRRELVQAVIRAMRDIRIRFANQASQAERRPDFQVTPQQQTQQFLYGFGKKSNAKVFLRGCGVPEDIIGTAMMRHGLPPDALVEDLEGSGIMDTLKNFAGSVADSASGWYDTIKANMPTMSDVRRAVAKVVPDSFQDYVPSGLKRTFGDKAKDFFGFGMSGGEFHDDPRDTQSRHRQPFENFFDDRGFRQGAVQRMTTMFVPEWELSSGINRLKGGDQLRDDDPELLRRQDHHDVSLYKPAVIQQPIHGYGHDGDEDEQFEGGLKQRLRKPIATDVIGRPYRKDPMLVHRVEDHDEFQPRTVGDEGLAHYEELEKPADMDEDPNPFRVRTENHKVNTGKLKKVTYHTK